MGTDFGLMYLVGRNFRQATFRQVGKDTSLSPDKNFIICNQYWNMNYNTALQNFFFEIHN